MKPGLDVKRLVDGSHAAQDTDDVARLSLLSEAGIRLAGSLDLGHIARELVDISQHWFAEGAGVYVLEHLIAEDPVPRHADDKSVELRRLSIGISGLNLEVVFPSGGVVGFPPDTPYAACVTTGLPQQFSVLGPHETGLIGHATDDNRVLEQFLELADFVLVPLRARAMVLGFAAFARGPKSAPFSAADVRLAEELAERAAICLDNARLYRRERNIAQALQAGLLPQTGDVVPGLEIVRRYRPAGSTALVGGDWYDVIPLSAGRAALVMGDAMGHGTAAAAAMVQLRAAARTLAILDLDPGEVLTCLDRVAQSLAPATFATCVYAVYDTTDRSCVCSRAGHPPPILAYPDGTCTLLDAPPGLPLGLGGVQFETVRMDIPDGATLALYTDGLVESRQRDIDTGLALLQSVLSEAEHGLGVACDSLINELVSEPSEDDVTLMLVRADS